MNTQTFFISVSIVSKSLLIVLGTLPLLANSKAIAPTLDLSCFSNIRSDCAYGWPLGMTLRRVPRYKIGNSFRLGFFFGRGRLAKIHCTSLRALAALRTLRLPHVQAVRAVLARSLCRQTYTPRVSK